MIAIDMPMPKNCYECPGWDVDAEARSICRIRKYKGDSPTSCVASSFMVTRDYDCPLKSAPNDIESHLFDYYQTAEAEAKKRKKKDKKKHKKQHKKHKNGE